MAAGKQRSRVTLVDVARLAGVSSSTASLVLSGRASELRIQDETSERVIQAAKQVGYVPNQVLRSVRKGRTNIISFYSAFRYRNAEDQYMDRMTAAVQYACGLFGYDVLVHCNYRRRPQETYQFLDGGWADGLILLAPLPDDPLLPYLRTSAMPTVLLNKPDPEAVLHSVCDNESSGLRLIANALVSRGHQRICAIWEDGIAAQDGVDRVQLLRQELQKLGVTLRILQVRHPLAEMLTELIESPEPPTALFAWNDRLAYQILEACDELGIRVPEQLSVVGYDGIHWPSTSRHIATSVKVDMTQLALQAMETLDALIESKGAAPLLQQTPATLEPGTTLAQGAQ